MVLGFDRNVCRMVAGFLKDRSFRVRVGNEVSDARPIAAGVPQGSLLGPVLYNIFLSDIPQPSERGLLLVYADDILVAASGPRAKTLERRMNTYLGILNEYFRKWGLRLNVDKTDGVLIKGRRGRLYPNSRSFIPNLVIDGRSLLCSDRFRYLDFSYTGRLSGL